MAAAAEAARRGASVALVEESAELGGKVLKSAPHGSPLSWIESREKRFSDRLMTDLRRYPDRITPILRHQVWHIQDGRTLELSPVGGASVLTRQLKAKRLIIATGAMERVRPFPGWTLPGVFPLGGLNSFVKHRVLPGKRYVVAGSGPLLPVLAHNLIRAGGRIAALVQTIPYRQLLRHASAIAAGIDGWKLFQGFYYLKQIIRNQVPVYSGAAVCWAEGNDRVKSVRIIRLNEKGRPVPGTESDIAADVVAVGYGLIPCTDLARICGCREVYDHASEYRRILRNDRMESSLAGVFLAGDGGTVKGYAAAALEGKLAGAGAARQAGFGTEADGGISALCQQLKRANRFGRVLDRLSAPPSGLLDLIPNETIICRCEEVRMKELRQAVDAGARDIHDLKRRTRTGMGQCQGRFCGQIINELLWNLLDRTEVKSPCRDGFTPRIPAKPCTLKDLIGTPK